MRKGQFDQVRPVRNNRPLRAFPNATKSSYLNKKIEFSHIDQILPSDWSIRELGTRLTTANQRS